MPVSEIQKTIHPTLHHYGLTTANLQTMVEWYATVLGMTVVFQTSSPLGKNAPIQVSAAWVTNDDANHRIGLIAMPQLTPDAQKSSHVRLQHTAYEYDSLDQLLDTYIRLRDKDIRPVLSADHGPTTSMYYADPDGNSVELFADCGECEACRRGDIVNCPNQTITGITTDGGYAEVVIAEARAIAAMPDGLSAEDAAPLMCAGTTVYNGLRNAGLRAGDLVAIQGIGGLGHLALQFARRMGFHTVAIARGKDKEDLARKLGAHVYIDSIAQDPAEALQKM